MATTPTPAPDQKPCIACRELIPADATVCPRCHTSQTPPRPDRLKPVMTWIGAISACIGLFVTLYSGGRWLIGHYQQNSETSAKLAIAQSQLDRGEYEPAFDTYSEILKSAPGNRAATDGQLNAAMQWTEHFHVIASDGKDAASLASAKLDQIMPVLDTALPQSHGEKKAGILAHIGWAHWLNQHIASREFGSGPAQSFHDALAIDSTNVYANAMLGNWMLQNGGDEKEAITHFRTAESTGKARPFVRSLEMGGLIGMNDSAAYAEIFRIANNMRKNNEPLDEDLKRRIVFTCCSFSVDSQEMLTTTLSSVPSDEAWATFLWLDDSPPSDSHLEHLFVRGNLDELSGNKASALAKYTQIKKEYANESFVVHERVDEAIQRISD